MVQVSVQDITRESKVYLLEEQLLKILIKNTVNDASFPSF